MTKQQYRTQIQQWRSSLSLAEWSERSASLRIQLEEVIAEINPERVHSFWPMEAKREVDIRPTLVQLTQRNIEVYMPVMRPDGMHHGRLTSENELELGSFSVLEPVISQRAIPHGLDLIIVPGLAFDLKGGRLGYGRGIYDRFLSKTGCLIVAPAFTTQIVSDIPVEPHDISVDILVTESAKHYV